MSTLAAPKTPLTFAVPKRQTDNGAPRNESLLRNFESVGTPAGCTIVYHLQRLKKASKEFIFRTACKAEKSHRTFAPRFDRKRESLKSDKKSQQKLF
ncbi:hypothetical protein I2I05_19970 [Hymenobacter sp. BT683]|uniref:Uncharacterized protein n=1 Tax=Hymenobacter jeongseonensis TaxID=2791027 RepID=A0ABS0IMY2_9BACT|nr:hypothetical protein [Hymenobacter jeongseonensis]MBF9239681.1 hypothetical protein [Hymenobacter jeongseonensis]